MALFGKKTDEAAAPAAKKPAAKKPAAKKPATKKAEAKPAASMSELYAETGAPKAEAKAAKKSKYDQAYRWIAKPLVTEKASVLGALNQYVFAVAKDANKVEVVKAIEAIYGVKPVSVNMLRVSGKQVRYGRIKGQRKDWKKAIVTLPAGKTIQVYEGV